MPYNRLRKFISACGIGTEMVYVPPDALGDARRPPFKLKTTSQILSFIANNGLENLKHKNTNEYRKDTPKKYKGVLVDAFYFTSGDKTGYIAFMYIIKDKKWHIKSFKENTDKKLKISQEAVKNLSSKRKGEDDE